MFSEKNRLHKMYQDLEQSFPIFFKILKKLKQKLRIIWIVGLQKDLGNLLEKHILKIL